MRGTTAKAKLSSISNCKHTLRKVLLSSSVADPGCLSWIPELDFSTLDPISGFFHPVSHIRNTKLTKDFEYFNPKIANKLPKICKYVQRCLSCMSDPDFFPSRIPYQYKHVKPKNCYLAPGNMFRQIPYLGSRLFPSRIQPG